MYYNRVWCRYRTLVVNLIAGASEGDVIVERHVGFALVKALEVSDDCRANVASMRLRLQIDLSDEIDGVGQRVLAIRIEHRLSLAKHELELVIVLEVVSRPVVKLAAVESELRRQLRRVETELSKIICWLCPRSDDID